MKIALLNFIAKGWNCMDIPALGAFRFKLLVCVYRILPLLGGVNFTRLVEWQFVLKNLPKPPAKVLDVGSTTSLFPFKINALGYETYCLDQRTSNFRLPLNIIFHRDDLMNLKFSDNIFDAVSCISVIEHIGMGRYNDPLCQEGDIKAMREMLRILKPNGRLIVTTNICSETQVVNKELWYGQERFYQLLEVGKVLAEEYYYFNGRRWICCDKEKVFSVNRPNFSLGMFVLEKQQKEKAKSTISNC